MFKDLSLRDAISSSLRGVPLASISYIFPLEECPTVLRPGLYEWVQMIFCVYRPGHPRMWWGRDLPLRSGVLFPKYSGWQWGGYDFTELGCYLCCLTVWSSSKCLSGGRGGVGIRNDPDLLFALKTAIKSFNIYSTPILPPNLFPSPYLHPFQLLVL